MGDVLPFKKPRRQTVRSSARRMLTEALDYVVKPVNVVIYAENEDGTFAVRTVHQDTVKPFDALARAEAAISSDKMAFLSEPTREHETL